MSGHFEFKLKSIYLNGLRTTNMIGPFKSIDFRFAPAFIFEFNFCLCFRFVLIWKFYYDWLNKNALARQTFQLTLRIRFVMFCACKMLLPRVKYPTNQAKRSPQCIHTLLQIPNGSFCYVLNAFSIRKRTILIHILFLSLHILIFVFEEVWSQENKLPRLFLFDRTSFFIEDQFDGNIV